VGTSGPSLERTEGPDGAEKVGIWFWLSVRKDVGGTVLCGDANVLPKTLSKSPRGVSREKPEGDIVLSVEGCGDLRKNGFVL
jgi:hypothetical protein